MNITEALEYIHAVNWVFCNPGLERVKILCEKLGNPQNDLKFIHVAGTNGKGSFCAITESILRTAGYTVGLFTSPYIVSFNERMRVNGENISDETLCALVKKIKPICEEMTDKPTEFELITALAFLYFKEQNCDYVVLECGLGGRLDATNIITTPILSVITGIALDHTSILGDTVEKIAAEKAGIIKKGIPLLWCGNHEGAQAVIRTKAWEAGAPFYTVDRSALAIKEKTLSGTRFDYREYKDLLLPLLGSYQPLNAVNSLSAIALLKKQGLVISEKAVSMGLANVNWPARFEIISKEPLMIADGGHNPEGIDSAVESIKWYFPTEKVGIVTGVMADKDYIYMANRISEVGAHIFCLTPDNPRALPASDYAKVFSHLGSPAEACESVADAVGQALAWATKEGKAIVSLGSLYMYGEVKAALENLK